jgi:hypothetical protein
MGLYRGAQREDEKASYSDGRQQLASLLAIGQRGRALMYLTHLYLRDLAARSHLVAGIIITSS